MTVKKLKKLLLNFEDGAVVYINEGNDMEDSCRKLKFIEEGTTLKNEFISNEAIDDEEDHSCDAVCLF